VTGTTGTWQPNGLDDVLSIVVAIAILDNTSRQIVKKDTTTGAIDATTGGKMADVFADPSDSNLSATPPKLMTELWQSVLTSGTFNLASDGVPQSAASQVRIYQRCFSLKSK
jgi:hypothetical protein